MHGQIAHFAINADDVATSQAFYEGVFGWSFQEYMPGFTRTFDAGGPIGAVQGRRALLDVPTNAPEVTFHVSDVDAFVADAVRLGGRVLLEKVEIPGAGFLAFVADPAGNVIGGIAPVVSES